MSEIEYNVWRFIRSDCRLANGDGRKVVAGETLHVEGPSVVGECGFHGAMTLLDSFRGIPNWCKRVYHLNGASPRLTSSRIGGRASIRYNIVAGTTLHTDWIATVQETRDFLLWATGYDRVPSAVWVMARLERSQAWRDEFELRANAIFHEMFGGTQ